MAGGGSVVYVCGDANTDVPEVRQTFVRICQERGMGGEEWLHKLEQDGRYLVDAFA